jgi:hypothetical protein
MKLASSPFSALFLMLLISGCGASKEETTSQLQRHVNAYKQVKVTPGNAKLVLKGADLLLSKSDSNKFSSFISLDQEKTVNKAKLFAAKAVECSDRINSWRGANPKDEWNQWKPNKESNESSQELASQVRLLKEHGACSELVAPLDSGQKAEIDRRIKATSDAEDVALAKEKTEREAAEKAEREKAQAKKAASFIRAKDFAVETAEDYNIMNRHYGGTCGNALYEIDAILSDGRFEKLSGTTPDNAEKLELKRIMRNVTGC